MRARFFADYGMVVILAILCAFLSVWTIAEQHPTGLAAADAVASRIIATTPADAKIVIIARDGEEDVLFARTVRERVGASGRVVVATVNGEPFEAAEVVRRLGETGVRIDAFAVTRETGDWSIFKDDAVRVQAPGHYGSVFLSTENLLNIANQIAVIAIMAIGLTMVIIAGGIDLSVGSLLAFSAVTCAWLIREAAGGKLATPIGMLLCCAAGIALCTLVGLWTGFLVTTFRVPPFIVTLGVMLLARGGAARLTQGETVFDVPDGFTWLGRGWTFGLLPNAVVLMLVLYAVAHVVMARTVLGRYLYAVGGNSEAARLAGVPVQRVLLLAYAVSGMLAGLGGVITASRLKGGAPTWGVADELYVIAAVVVGGTSLSGGEGKIFGTLIGAFLIAVIQNGMNLLGLRSWDQEIVLGGVIILAVLFDRVKQFGWLRPGGR